MDILKILEVAKLVGVILCVFFASAWAIVFVTRYNGFNDKVIYPWEKEERRAAKKAAREKAREERRQAKRWRELEKQYR